MIPKQLRGSQNDSMANGESGKRTNSQDPVVVCERYARRGRIYRRWVTSERLFVQCFPAAKYKGNRTALLVTKFLIALSLQHRLTCT